MTCLNRDDTFASYIRPNWQEIECRQFSDSPNYGDGKQMVKGDKVDYFGLAGYSVDELKKMGYFVWMSPQQKGSWLGEGDNATFMNMLGNGLRAYEKGFYGGWGGRVIAAISEPSNPFATETSADQMASQMGTRNNPQNIDAVPNPDFFAQA